MQVGPEVGLRGFSLPPREPPGDCLLLADYNLRMEIILRKEGKDFEPWRSFVGRCSSLVSKNYLAMLSATSEDLRDRVNLRNFLRKSLLSPQQVEDILALQKDHRRWRKKAEMIDMVISFAAKKDHSFTEREKMLELAADSDSLFLSNIVELGLAARVGNRGWAQKAARRLLRLGKDGVLFHLENYFPPDAKKMRAFEEACLSLIGELQVTPLRSMLLSLLGEVFGRPSEGNSLSDIRKAVKSKRLGGGVFGFWVSKLSGRTSEVELGQVFRWVVTESFVRRMDLIELWVFGYHYPGEEKLRKLILDNIERAWESARPWSRHMVLRLLKNNAIKRALGERNKTFRRARFQLERELYRDFLRRPVAVNYSLGKLARLGDRDENRLWWLVFR